MTVNLFIPGMALFTNDHPERDGVIVNFEMNLPEKGGSLLLSSILSIAFVYPGRTISKITALTNEHYFNANFWRVLI